MVAKFYTKTETHPGLVVSRAVQPISWFGVPEQFWNKVSAVCRSFSDCLGIVQYFGDANFCPLYPVLLMIPNPVPFSNQPIVYNQIDGEGLAPAAEIQDLAVYAWETVERRLRKNRGNPVDFDSLREQHGMIRSEDVDAAIRQALRDAAAKHAASPVTNPGRQPRYRNPTNATKFPQQPDNSSWKREEIATTNSGGLESS